MSNILLEQQENQNTGSRGFVHKYQLKIHHLNELNKKLFRENDDLNSKIQYLQKINDKILNQQECQNFIIDNLNKQIQSISKKNSQLLKQNQLLLSTILLNEQMSIQTRKETQFYVGRYQQKIVELRQNMQVKQVQIQILEQKYQKQKGLQLPMNMKNANRFTSEILKYQTLIEEMIQQRSKHRFGDFQEIQTAYSNLNKQKSKPKQKDIKSKSSKIINPNPSTDIRPNINRMAEGNIFQTSGSQRVQVLFLRLHMQLRDLKKKLKDKTQLISELKTKDKIMKQGYNLITKEMEKLKVENFQLKIQMDHLDKKVKTSHQISRVLSVGNIRKTFMKQTTQRNFPSQVSIEANISEVKNCLKVTMPSETGGNKSHNFDQRIENIQGLLSLDSNPEFKDKKNQRQIKRSFDDEQLSVCEQNEVDISISLDASGFMAPQKSHQQISEHILTGLIDKKIF